LLVFKIFKLGPDHLCIIYKGVSSVAVKLAISCYEDKVDGAQKINHHTITNLYEIFDIQLLETTERVDFLMIGITVQNSNFLHKLLHMYMTVDDDGKIFISENLNQVDFSHQLLQAHQPLDVIFDFIADSEGANHVTVKMVAEDEPPVIAKFNMTFTGNVVNLKFLRLMKLSIKDLAYCVNRNEAILYNPKNRKIWAQWRSWASSTSSSSSAFLKKPCSRFSDRTATARSTSSPTEEESQAMPREESTQSWKCLQRLISLSTASTETTS